MGLRVRISSRSQDALQIGTRIISEQRTPLPAAHALREQLGELDFYSNVCYHPARAEAAELLVRYPEGSGRGLDHIQHFAQGKLRTVNMTHTLDNGNLYRRTVVQIAQTA